MPCGAARCCTVLCLVAAEYQYQYQYRDTVTSHSLHNHGRGLAGSSSSQHRSNLSVTVHRNSTASEGPPLLVRTLASRSRRLQAGQAMQGAPASGPWRCDRMEWQPESETASHVSSNRPTSASSSQFANVAHCLQAQRETHTGRNRGSRSGCGSTIHTGGSARFTPAASLKTRGPPPTDSVLRSCKCTCTSLRRLLSFFLAPCSLSSPLERPSLPGHSRTLQPTISAERPYI